MLALAFGQIRRQGFGKLVKTIVIPKKKADPVNSKARCAFLRGEAGWGYPCIDSALPEG